MAVLTLTKTWAASEIPAAGDMNDDLNAIASFCNNNVVHVDGSKAMTGILVLPNADPASANQATRKQYVDTKAAAATAAALTHAVETASGKQYMFVAGSITAPLSLAWDGVAHSLTMTLDVTSLAATEITAVTATLTVSHTVLFACASPNPNTVTITIYTPTGLVPTIGTLTLFSALVWYTK